MVDSSDRQRAHDEFLAEAQELIESLSRDLLLLDESQKQGQSNPDALNDLFRGVHTLKGLAGMFGFERIGSMAHVLEDLLEDLRLGRAELTQHTLDVLFEGADGFQRLMAEAKTGELADIDLDAFSTLIHSVSKAEQSAPNILADYDLDPGMLSVLTEYEEHRLRTNLEHGSTVYRLRIRLPLDVIDSALEDIKQRCKNVAEIITYLPSMDGGGGDSIDIEMLMASQATEADLRAALDRQDGKLTVVQRRVRISRSPDPRPPVPSQRPKDLPEPTFAQAAPARTQAEQSASLRSLSSVVRVDIRKLDHLMNVVGELGTVRSGIGRVVEKLRNGGDAMRELASETHRIHRTFNRYLTEVQEGVLDIRMVPLSQLFDKVAVIVRQTARDLGKDVRLLVTGSETEVDKLIAEELADPLMHIVRNAIDHGVEFPEQRAASGKQSQATVTINAYHKGNHVVIEMSDDGRGIDSASVRESAIRKGLLSDQAVADISRQELLQVIFMPGFSTAAQVTDLSGRGVGMDVVKTNINRLGGAVDIESEEGVGTKVTITLPITLAIINALLFEVRGRLMSIPLASVQEALRLDSSMIGTIEGREVLTLRGETLPLCRLADLFKFAGESPIHSFVIVVVVGNRRLGLAVDRLAGQQDIVIKGLGRSLANVPGISGATDLGDQRLVLVVDAASIMDEVLAPKGNHLLVGGPS
ncbi:MAG: chemotaxis protein CheA [Myxococcales bacterium]|nr:chemotaxis protein CheA [Myxococcales bacterium]MDD9969835.1 chemotaxis protein CheA [Myxococcales bacterium]